MDFNRIISGMLRAARLDKAFYFAVIFVISFVAGGILGVGAALTGNLPRN